MLVARQEDGALGGDSGGSKAALGRHQDGPYTRQTRGCACSLAPRSLQAQAGTGTTDEWLLFRANGRDAGPATSGGAARARLQISMRLGRRHSTGDWLLSHFGWTAPDVRLLTVCCDSMDGLHCSTSTDLVVSPLLLHPSTPLHSSAPPSFPAV